MIINSNKVASVGEKKFINVAEVDYRKQSILHTNPFKNSFTVCSFRFIYRSVKYCDEDIVINGSLLIERIQIPMGSFLNSNNVSYRFPLKITKKNEKSDSSRLDIRNR